ncbi:MAG: PorV/PorQ family protein [Balneolales bacterium]
MKRLTFASALLLSLVLSGPPLIAQQSSGFQFLNIGPTAKSLGISEAHTAVSLGASSIYTNPALLSFEKESSSTLSYLVWQPAGTQTSHAAVNLKRDDDAFGFGLISSKVDDIEQRSVSGPPSGSIAVQYLSLAGAYSKNFGYFSVGATGMYLYEQLYNFDASGFALSAGAATNILDERLRIGVALLNYGQMQDLQHEATELPASFKVGVDIQALQFSASGSNKIPFLFVISSDFVKPLNEPGLSQASEGNSNIFRQDEAYFNLALQVEISEIIILRSGYKTNHPNRSASFGAGVRVSNLDFDYAFAPFDTGMGTNHGISVAYYF